MAAAAEKTEAQKVEEHFLRQEAHEERLNATLKMYETRIHEMRETSEERKKELLAQNDGLLGAVGRLYAENEALNKRVASLEPALKQADEKLKNLHDMAQVEIERAHRELDEKCNTIREQAKTEVERAKLDAKAEIDRLKAELKRCQGRKAR